MSLFLQFYKTMIEKDEEDEEGTTLERRGRYYHRIGKYRVERM